MEDVYYSNTDTNYNGIVENFEDYNHRNDVVVLCPSLCRMEETSFPKKEFLKSLAGQWSACLGSGAQPWSWHLWPGEVGVGLGSKLKEQPSMFL